MYGSLLHVLFVLSLAFLINGTRNNITDNIAPKGNVSQSTTLNYENYDWNARFAIDGNTGFNVTCKCCSGTYAGSSWWELDLGSVQNIGRIDVYGRNDRQTDQLLGFSLYLSNTSQSTSGLIYRDGITEDEYRTRKGHYVITVGQTPGRYVSITLDKQTSLVICEVMVFKACPDGQYEPNCDACNCGGGPCNKTDGTCTACPVGSYGVSCSPCGNCLQGNITCNTTTGHCPSGCAAGYTGSTCLQECAAGTFGVGCLPCGHCLGENLSCDRTTGQCPGGCAAGYTGDTCHECTSGYYGAGCSPCGHCIQGSTSCNKTTGQCPGGCVAGYTGSTCHQECSAGTYGVGCSPCGHCIQGSTSCNKTTGQCPGGCAAGYRGSTCHQDCPDGSYGAGCLSCGHCRQDNPCDKTTGHCPNGCEVGYRGDICQQDEDLLPRIRNNLTIAMSTPVYEHMNASLAIDFSNGTLPDTCHCCSATLANQSWWRLGLGQIYPIRGIKLIGRSDKTTQNGYYTLQLSNTSLQEDSPVKLSQHIFYWNLSNILASTITISRATVLVICELKVYEGDCSVGYFGTSCDQECHCEDNLPCNRTTGTCSAPRCKPGWRGQSCSEECTSPSFGPGCSHTCHCINGSLCNHVTGTCDIGVCDPGWKGTSCNMECISPEFGQNCSNTCHCKNNKTCNHVNGSCEGGLCEPGWNGTSCDTECVSPSFGQNCFQTCHCINGSHCNRVSGICDKGVCEPGWKEKACDSVCESPLFGPNCSNTCHCIDESDCHHVTGTCNRSVCDQGWKGPSCDTECVSPSFGQNCSRTCHCIEGSECSHVTGTCNHGLCDPGWQTPSCDTKCESPAFGQNCSNTCHCINGNQCDHVTGKCQLCEAGWEGLSCDKECNFPTFGTNCSHTCHCINSSSCDHVDGTCDLQICDPGWQGTSCDSVCDNFTFGPNCSLTCHCDGKSNCNHVNGTCDKKQCESGWQGSACDRVCDNSTYGEGCKGRCFCAGDQTCDKANGSCPLGLCADGYEGNTCSSLKTDQGPSIAPVAGGTAAAVIVIAVIIVVIFVLRRKGILKKADKTTDFDKLNATPNQGNGEVNDDTLMKARANPIYAADNETFEENEEQDERKDEYYNLNTKVKGTFIKLPELWHFIRMNEAEDFRKLYDEYATVPRGLQHKCEAASLPLNRPKNRYKQMYAYDHSRVRLIDCDPGQTDYINACYINGFEKQKKFIASQGPQDEMIGDFWDMVAQQKATTIVMLTNLTEHGSIKCVKYWEEDEISKFGHVTLEVKKTETFDNYIVRHFKITYRQQQSRLVTQYHFTVWPDKDVPATCRSLVGFWRDVMKKNSSPEAPPIIVHCSAGVGRTGTFIALDYLYNQGRAKGAIHPLETLRLLRDQRVLMIQTKLQYVYLHKTVAEALYLGTESIPADIFQDTLDSLSQTDPSTKKPNLLMQYEMVQKFGDSCCDQTESVYQNTAATNLEVDAYKPKNSNRNSQNIQDYGAIELPNYANKNTFILTASPVESKLNEFWWLITEQNIKTVVMVTEPSSPSFKASCTLGNGKVKGSLLKIAVVEQKKSSFGNEMTFSVSKGEDVQHTVKQFQYTDWKDRSEVPGDITSVLEFLEQIQRWQTHLSKGQPILIHCGNGLFRSAVICVLLNELQRLRRDSEHVNILESAMMMKKRNAGLIQSFAQYRFLYDAINSHLNSSAVYQNV